MKSNYEVRVVRDKGTQVIPLHCTLRQGNNVCAALAYAAVEQDASRIELWLKTRTLEKRVSHSSIIRRG